MSVEVNEISFDRGETEILKNVSFSLSSGTFVKLIGISGCGKTSLLRVFAGLDLPKTGNICINSNEGITQIGYVPQTLSLWPNMSLYKNIVLPHTNVASISNKLNTICEELAIHPYLCRRPSEVSQGQCQRAAIVRALLLEPALLLMDEATAALDQEMSKRVWSLVRRETERGAVAIVTSHNYESFESDLTYEIIASDNPPNQIIRKERIC